MAALSYFQLSRLLIGFSAALLGNVAGLGLPAALSRYKDRPSLTIFLSPSIFPFNTLTPTWIRAPSC